MVKIWFNFIRKEKKIKNMGCTESQRHHNEEYQIILKAEQQLGYWSKTAQEIEIAFKKYAN